MKKLSLMLLFSIVITSSFSQKILDDIKNGDYASTEKWLNKMDVISETYMKESMDGEESTEVNVIEWAAFFNQTEIVELFLENEEKFTYFEDWINIALSASVHNCNIELTQMLISSGAEPVSNCGLCNDASPLGIAIAHECMDVYLLLRSAGAPLVTEDSGYDLIHAAAGNKDLDFLKNLVEKEKLDVNQKGTSIAYPIIVAIKEGRIENIKYLISKGAKLDFISQETSTLNLTALHYIEDLPTFQLFEKIMETNDQISIEKSDATYPMLMAIIQSDDRALFDYFVKNYSSFLKTKNSWGQNAMFALLDTEKETAYFFSVLKNLGISSSIKDDYGKDLKYYAKKENNKTLFELVK